MRYDTLQLASATLRRHRSDDRHHREYLVNGRPLSRLLPQGDRLSAFGWLDPRVERDFARALLLKSPSSLAPGRAALYVCSECASLGCGALTVMVVRYDDRYAWKDFGLESDLRAESIATCAEGYEFHFAREAYESVFKPLA
jgi:hypothetical protein